MRSWKRSMGWLLLIIALLFVGLDGFVVAINKPLPQTEHDLEIVRRARALLVEPGVWARGEDRECAPDQAGLGLHCALRRASEEITGGFAHRAAALEAVRAAIDAARPDAGYRRPLREFNDAPDVTLDDVLAVLREAEAALAATAAAGQGDPASGDAGA